MKYESCSMKTVANEAAVRAGKPGSFAIEHVVDGEATFKRMWVHLPDGTIGGLTLAPAPAAVPMQWPWNDAEKKPTIKRAIQLRGRWCGEIKGGRMIGAAREDDQLAPVATPPAVPPPNRIRGAVRKAVSSRRR